ncbi:MAG: polyphosphate kinase 2 family protein, partial [Limnobacter sp.]|nr:polyphosphate kinase 2 family protein [Limnobacter sp.]
SHYDALIMPIIQENMGEAWLEKRVRQVNEFEALLTDSGATVLKIFLNISREEQESRLIERWESPYKRWKLNADDLKATEDYSLYANAYEKVLEKTCTSHAPWWIIPGDHKGFRNMITAEILVGTLERMGLAWPSADPEVVKSEFWKKSKAPKST